MSDVKQPEEMRPIPDGGLKDAMPSWLKRPPAWRNMPTAEERHERTLPEPDTSQINPHSLLDVSDLPQWLQTIAERGELPAPQPDAAVSHAVEQLQAAASQPIADPPQPANEEPEVDASAQPEPVLPFVPDSTTVDSASPTETTPSAAPQIQPAANPPARSPWLFPGLAVVLILVIVLIALLYTL